MQTECAVCWDAEFPLAGEAEVVWVLWQVPSQNIYILKWVSRSNSFGPSVVQKFFFWHSSALHTNGKRCS